VRLLGVCLLRSPTRYLVMWLNVRPGWSRVCWADGESWTTVGANQGLPEVSYTSSGGNTSVVMEKVDTGVQ